MPSGVYARWPFATETFAGLLMKAAPSDVITPSCRSLFAGRIGTGITASPFWLPWITESRPRPPAIEAEGSPAKVAEKTSERMVPAPTADAFTSWFGEPKTVHAHALGSTDAAMPTAPRQRTEKMPWFADWNWSAFWGEGRLPSKGAFQVGFAIGLPFASVVRSRFAFGPPAAPPGFRQSGSVPTPRPPIIGASESQ